MAGKPSSSVASESRRTPHMPACCTSRPDVHACMGVHGPTCVCATGLCMGALTWRREAAQCSAGGEGGSGGV